MKRVLLFILSVLVIFTMIFPYTSVAAKPVGVIRDFSFESNVITKVHDFNKTDIFVGDPFGRAESVSGEGYSGSQSVHLQANDREYSNVYSKVKGPVELDDIIEISFWYKHFPDSDEVTPFLVLWFELYNGSYLCIVQWPYLFLGLNTNWTKFDSDRWLYLVFDPNWLLVSGDYGPFLLSDIQVLFDGALLKNEACVGIAAGFWGYYCNALVDELAIIT